jgi:TonB family protein
MSLPMTSGWPLAPHPDDPHAPQRLASLVGPPAVRDEYCVRALDLTLRHLDQLPLSSLGGRRGRTVVTIRILGDGTINSVAIAQSSGYPDIDQRVQKMVFAVGQYPPLPPRIPGSWADFTFAMVFPDPRQR